MKRVLLLVALTTCLDLPDAHAQPTFSVDFQGPSVLGGLPDGFFAVPVTSGDILTTSLPGPATAPNPPLPGPLPLPGIEIGAPPGAIGAVPGGLGILPGINGLPELDALSYGRDSGSELFFSVDEFAVGVAGTAPDVFSEGAPGLAEASADVFRYLGPIAPIPPVAAIGNAQALDGNGLGASGLPGVGLLEPNPATPAVLPDTGDNLDAVDMDTNAADLLGPIFFSLDSLFPDPLEVFPANSGTALGNGVSGADILVSFAGGAPALAIPGALLGLDLFGLDTDDLDALYFDDADGSVSLTAPDTIAFSVRRGSAIIGTPDSFFGVPIEEGDVLTRPPAAGLPPSILISAEALGLATIRSGTAGPFGADELDALDLRVPPPPPPSTPVPTLTPGMGALIALVLVASGALALGAPRRA